VKERGLVQNKMQRGKKRGNNNNNNSTGGEKADGAKTTLERTAIRLSAMSSNFIKPKLIELDNF